MNENLNNKHIRIQAFKDYYSDRLTTKTNDWLETNKDNITFNKITYNVDKEYAWVFIEYYER